MKTDDETMRRIYLAIAILIALTACVSGAPPRTNPSIQTVISSLGERITSFHSLIEVHQDGSLTATETISVVADGTKIKRGIFRTLPTERQCRNGTRFHVPIKVLKTKRDGQDEPYHIKSLPGEMKIYLGKADVFLEPGQYTYTLSYKIEDGVSLSGEFQMLYWNVTGSCSDFNIGKATAEIHLPRSISVLEASAYTGTKQEKDDSFKYTISSDGIILFETTRVLMPNEGLTIMIIWPKGLIEAPNPCELNKVEKGGRP